MKDNDVVVNTAEVDTVGRDGVASKTRHESLTVLGLLDECTASAKRWQHKAYARAVLNERFVHGEQIPTSSDVDPNSLVRAWPAWLEARVPRNVLRNKALTMIARATKDEPAVRAWGVDGGESDSGAAATANNVLAYYRQKHDHRTLTTRAAWLALAHGAVAFKVCWADDDKGGDDIVEDVLSIFEFGTDGAERIEDAKWCFIKKLVDKHAARALLWGAQITREVSTTTETSTLGDTIEGVECFELWHLPTSRIPEGLYALIVDGAVVEAVAFPYEHGELPIAVWKWNDRHQSPLGDTPVTDAVPLQDELNRLNSALALVVARTAQWMKVIGPKGVVEQWNGDQQIIEANDADLNKSVRIIGAPPPSPLFLERIGKVEQEIDQIMGATETITGSDASASKNARHLAYLSELDAQKYAMTTRNLAHARLRVERQKLALVRQYVKEERTARIIGDDGKMQVVSFYGADLNGVDVVLEPASGTAQTKTAQAAQVEKDAAAGAIDPATASELRETGGTTTAYERLARSLVARQIDDLRRGYVVEADPSIPPQVAVSAIMLDVQTRGDTEDGALIALARAYAAQSQQPIEGAAPAAPMTNEPTLPEEMPQ